jgi:photosystem II stability/assembly factor-like uncharacterized protein
MLNRTAFASAMCFLASHAASQLVTQSPFPTGRNLGGVAFTSPTHGFIVGDNHHLIESFDGGHSWTTRMASPLSSDPFYTITFADSLHGYIAGNNQDAYRTTNGGLTWTQMTGFQPGSAGALDFVTPTRGYAGYNGALTFTPDGGTTWQIASAYPDCPIMFGMDFRDEFVGLASGIRSTPYHDDGIYRTLNAGRTWTLVHTGSVNDLIWIDEDSALAIDATDIIRSDDEGRTWYVVAYGTVPTGLGEFVQVGNTDTLAGVSLSGDIWMSYDMGLSWTQRVYGIGVLPARWSVSFFDLLYGWVVGANGLTYSTIDGGTTWTLLNSGCGDEVQAIDFAPGERFGIAVTHRGFVFRTRDQGRFWDVQRLRETGVVFGREEGLRAVEVLDDNTIITGGAGGVLFRSDDGGTTWLSLGWPNSLPDTFEIKAINFADRYNGFIAGFGAGPSAYSTTDGGFSWSPITGVMGSMASGDLEGSSRWMITAGTTVYRSTNDGATWSSQVLPGDVTYLYDIEFNNPQYGWVIGSYGYTARTSNGGATWTQVVQPVNESYLDVEMLGNSEVMLLGYDSSTFRYFTKTSSNGGATWIRTTLSQYEEGLNELWASPTGRYWIGGSWGKIVHSAAPALRIVLPADVPVQVAPGVPFTFSVRVVPGDDLIEIGSPTMWLQRAAAGPFEPIPLTHVFGEDYLATLPPLRCADTPRFYFSARGTEGAEIRLPASAPATTFSTRVGVNQTMDLLNTDFSAGLPAGWGVSGLWHIGTACAPPGTCDVGNTAYFGQDSTCNFNLPSRVSGILRSPNVTLPVLQPGQNVVLTFCSALDTEYQNGAYGDDDQSQVWFVYQGGANPVAWLTDHSTSRIQTFNVNHHAGRTGRFEWRFDSMNTYMNAFRGWHVDNIRLTAPGLVCNDPCPQDFNADGTLDFFDYADFVECFEGGPCPPGATPDYNRDNSTDFFDYADFVAAFETGC